MYCPYFAQTLCQSCTCLDTAYPEQVQKKQRFLRSLLELSDEQLCSPVLSEEQGFRNKAKMVVLGIAQAPVLGIEHPETFEAIALTDCPLYPKPMQQLLAALPAWIKNAGLPPYNRHKRKGELKYILLSQSQHTGQFMLRFVLHSEKLIERIKLNLPQLHQQFPAISVITANIQPVHMARLEGDLEIFLTDQQMLAEEFNQIPFYLKPKSFFQTNPTVAAKLYATATRWAKESGAEQVWDLFCGVGGFALHCAPHFKSVVGIEIEPEAIACAQLSAQAIGVSNLTFAALDSTDFSQSQQSRPDLVIVNPPRRGLGRALVERLNQIAPATILYSSCNPHSLASDLKGLEFDLVRVQWFDMFPHTSHMEVLVELRRRFKPK